ncbi:MAG TPA: maleylpyruvate isomerase N-terminal domain-containing protein [Polyangium sp.]|nr:maleylpyruvate isomerase N-terminal domain-containing protein [Polyangium sp.]
MLPLPPIETRHLFREINAETLDLCAKLSPDDWDKPTVHADRNVKDLVAHLLDGSLRRLAIQRDGHFLQAPDMRSFSDMVGFVQQLNREWIVAAKRLSPRVIMDLMMRADEEVAALFSSLEPQSPSAFGVAWAGEEWSESWFDMAREYTEKWHHQQQIRDAVGRPGFTERRFLHPVLDTFLRGAPHAYRNTRADEGTMVEVEIRGEAGGKWQLVCDGDRWTLVTDCPTKPTTRVELDADTAWRLWTKGTSGQTAREKAQVTGDEALAAPLFSMVTIMA